MSNNPAWTSKSSHAFQIEKCQNILHTCHNMICTRYYTREVLCYILSCGFNEVDTQGALLQPRVGWHLCNIKRSSHHVERIACYMVFTHHAHIQWKHDILVRFEMVSAVRNWEVGIIGCETPAITNHSWLIKTWGHVINRSEGPASDQTFSTFQWAMMKPSNYKFRIMREIWGPWSQMLYPSTPQNWVWVWICITKLWFHI